MHYHFILTIITAVFAGVGASAVLKHQPMTANKLVQDIGEIRDDIHNCTTQGAGWSNWNGLQAFRFQKQAIHTIDKIKSTTKGMAELAPLSPEKSKEALEIFGQVRDEEVKFMDLASHTDAMHHGPYSGYIKDGLDTIKDSINKFCAGFGDHLTGDFKQTAQDECTEMIKACEDAKAKWI